MKDFDCAELHLLIESVCCYIADQEQQSKCTSKVLSEMAEERLVHLYELKDKLVDSYKLTF